MIERVPSDIFRGMTLTDLIDSLFNKSEARRVVALLTDHAPSRFGEWLAYFGDHDDFVMTAAVMLGSIDEQRLLSWRSATNQRCEFLE